MGKTNEELANEMELALGARLTIENAPRTIAGLARLPKMRVRILYQELTGVKYAPDAFLMGTNKEERARVVRDLLLQLDKRKKI